jgi:peptidoglycan/xylan/chitin deacetylase (PgdA/CDA1 family)/glycosyltransferase involved in cell wall biosynthesis
MKIAYACYASAFVADGVNQKITAQIAHWRAEGHDAQLFCLSPAPEPASAASVLDGRLFTFNDIQQRIAATVAMARAVRRFAPDIIYVRYDVFVPPVWLALRSLPIVIEINTDDRTEALAERPLGRAYHRLTRRLTLGAAAAFACVTHELADPAHLHPGERPVIVIANGVDAEDVEPLPPAGGRRPSAAMLVGYRSGWSGVDQALAIARAIPTLEIHLIGPEIVPDGLELPPNVTVHGRLDRSGYRQVLAGVDVGIGPLALHRKGMNEASPLKVREYLLHGLPVVIAYADTDFLDDDPWFLLRLPNTEDNIAPNLDRIADWLAAVQGRRVPRVEVIDRISMGSKERARLRFFAAVIDARRGGAGEPTAVPALKPRAYYHAVNRYERARTAISARRSVPPARPGVRILGYHRVADDGDVLAVTRDAFRRQMELIRHSNTRIVRLDDVPGLLTAPLEESHICVTFDDGYLDTLESAAPILRELEIPATVFLPTAMIDGTKPYYWYRASPPAALDWAGVAELTADGVIDVQSHSRSHPRLPALSEDKARDELVTSKTEIERHIGRAVTSFCYPAGLYGAREVELAREAGYRTAVTCRPGLNLPGTDPLQLLRNLISWSDDAARFEAKLNGRLDRPGRLTEAMQRWRATRGAK